MGSSQILYIPKAQENLRIRMVEGDHFRRKFDLVFWINFFYSSMALCPNYT